MRSMKRRSGIGRADGVDPALRTSEVCQTLETRPVFARRSPFDHGVVVRVLHLVAVVLDLFFPAIAVPDLDVAA